jgi:hypothetical protein
LPHPSQSKAETRKEQKMSRQRRAVSFKPSNPPRRPEANQAKLEIRRLRTAKLSDGSRCFFDGAQVFNVGLFSLWQPVRGRFSWDIDDKTHFFTAVRENGQGRKLVGAMQCRFDHETDRATLDSILLPTDSALTPDEREQLIRAFMDEFKKNS